MDGIKVAAAVLIAGGLGAGITSGVMGGRLQEASAEASAETSTWQDRAESAEAEVDDLADDLADAEKRIEKLESKLAAAKKKVASIPGLEERIFDLQRQVEAAAPTQTCEDLYWLHGAALDEGRLLEAEELWQLAGDLYGGKCQKELEWNYEDY